MAHQLGSQADPAEQQGHVGEAPAMLIRASYVPLLCVAVIRFAWEILPAKRPSHRFTC